MISVNAVTGEIYLQLQPKSKAEDVAEYLADLCKDAHKENGCGSFKKRKNEVRQAWGEMVE